MAWSLDVQELERRANEVVRIALDVRESNFIPTAPLISKCFTEGALSALNSLKAAYLHVCKHDAIDNLIWLAITGILRECSAVGTAQWQYVLPKKTKAKVKEPFAAFLEKINIFKSDIALAQKNYKGTTLVLEEDARELTSGSRDFDLVITSPPYPNNFDYADATRLEMTFWGEVSGWGDLQLAVRRYLVRSCSQHSAAERLDIETLLRDPVLQPIHQEISRVCDRLGEIRFEKGGKKTYHTMIAAYFCDLANAWKALRLRVKCGGRVAFVIGDSAPYGVHVPSEKWLGELAIQAGFADFRFEKLRARNVKWKNRKHSVPLHEGILWVEA